MKLKRRGKYAHISRNDGNTPGITYNVGRNKAKREKRAMHKSFTKGVKP